MLQIERLPVGMAQANCYIVHNQTEALIIDPGAQGNQIIQTITDLGVEPVAVLLTHTHYDHIGAVEQIRAEYSIPVYVSVKEQDWLQDPSKNLSGLLGENLIIEEAEHVFQSDESISISDFQFTVVSTPGHSPGGVSFVFEEDEFVITGDALFAGSIGRTDLPGSQPEQLFKGIREKLFILPDQYTAYPGHGPQTNIGHEKKTNPFFQ